MLKFIERLLLGFTKSDWPDDPGDRFNYVHSRMKETSDLVGAITRISLLLVVLGFLLEGFAPDAWGGFELASWWMMFIFFAAILTRLGCRTLLYFWVHFLPRVQSPEETGDASADSLPIWGKAILHVCALAFVLFAIAFVVAFIIFLTHIGGKLHSL